MSNEENNLNAPTLDLAEVVKEQKQAAMRRRCDECGESVPFTQLIESGGAWFCFSCAAKGADRG